MLPGGWTPSASFRTDFAFRALETWLPLGASANSVLEALQQWDLGIRRQDFLRVADAVRQSQSSEMKIRGQDRDQLIPAAQYTERDWLLTSNYTYRVNVFGTDPNTGDKMEINRLIGSDDRLSPNELEGVVRQLSEPTSDSLALEIGGVQAYGVIVRTGFFA
jgi:hypothetical protein